MSQDDKEKPGLLGQIKDKLVRSKQEWAKEGRLLTGRPDFGQQRSRIVVLIRAACLA